MVLIIPTSCCVSELMYFCIVLSDSTQCHSPCTISSWPCALLCAAVFMCCRRIGSGDSVICPCSCGSHGCFPSVATGLVLLESLDELPSLVTGLLSSVQTSQQAFRYYRRFPLWNIRTHEQRMKVCRVLLHVSVNVCKICFLPSRLSASLSSLGSVATFHVLWTHRPCMAVDHLLAQTRVYILTEMWNIVWLTSLLLLSWLTWKTPK